MGAWCWLVAVRLAQVTVLEYGGSGQAVPVGNGGSYQAGQPRAVLQVVAFVTSDQATYVCGKLVAGGVTLDGPSRGQYVTPGATVPVAMQMNSPGSYDPVRGWTPGTPIQVSVVAMEDPGGGGACQPADSWTVTISSATPTPPAPGTHLECSAGICTRVQGTGVDRCPQEGSYINCVGTHLECVNGVCSKTLGAGTDLCLGEGVSCVQGQPPPPPPPPGGSPGGQPPGGLDVSGLSFAVALASLVIAAALLWPRSPAPPLQ